MTGLPEKNPELIWHVTRPTMFPTGTGWVVVGVIVLLFLMKLAQGI